MHDFKLVTVFNTRDELLEEATSLWFRHFAVGDDVVKQLPACKFEHDDDVGRSRDDFVAVALGGDQSKH